MAIAGYAVGAKRGYVYVRKEYPRARAALLEAIAEARAGGFLGDETLHRSFSFDVELVVGQGSYVCGEETSLLNSIEGRRPEVRVRPPYPTASGLFGKPTLVNNVETLVNVPWIIEQGSGAYRDIGFSKSRGTKVLSLNSLFARPGLYEVPFGMSIRRIIEDLGGGLQTGRIRGVIIGGPLAGVIPPSCFDTPLGFEELNGIGASVGHGGILAFDDYTSLQELVQHVFAFAAFESCGVEKQFFAAWSSWEAHQFMKKRNAKQSFRVSHGQVCADWVRGWPNSRAAFFVTTKRTSTDASRNRERHPSGICRRPNHSPRPPVARHRSSHALLRPSLKAVCRLPVVRCPRGRSRASLARL
jgi:hypothetical protein